MQDLIKRYFWVVGALTVMVCAILAAKAFGHVIEAVALGDSKQAPKIAAPPPRTEAPKPTRVKDGTQLTARNMFCSECTPEVIVPTDPSQIAITTLPLALLATNIGTTEEQSYATVVNNYTFAQGSYSVGDKLPGASGPIKTIRYKFVDFEHNGRIERVMLGGEPPTTRPATVAAAPAPAGDGDELQAAVDAGIKKIDDTTYEIDKSLVDKVIANPMAFTRGARVVPAMKNGKPEGIKLYAIRPTSPYAKLGLTNGDTLQSINGFELNSMEKGLEIYGKLREATSLEVEIQRRGKPVTLKYRIR
jgi:general secretion pathway protein C